MADQEQGQMGVALFTPIAPPKLVSISHADLVEWKKKRVEYEAQVETRCAGNQEKVADLLVSVKNSMDRQLLNACCEYEWDVEEDDLTEDELNKYLDAIIKSVKNETLPDVDHIFGSNLKMDMKETDVKARIMKYFAQFDQLISEHGISSLFEGEKGMKEKCKVLREHLHPSGLRSAVEQALRYGDDKAKNTPKLLYKLVKEKALEQDKLYHLRKQGEREPPRGKNAGQQHGRQQHGARSKQWKVASDGKKKQEFRKVAVGQGQQQSFKARTDISANKDDEKAGVTCFKCGGPHYKVDCPEIDEAEREKLMERQQKKKKYRSAKRMLSDDPYGPVAWLNGLVKLPYCADSGSDDNLISRRHIKQLMAADPSVTVIKLDKPVKGKAIGGQIVESNEAVYVRITMETAAGPVRLQEPKLCVILDTDEDELIVGDRLLKELGIDVGGQLEMLATQTIEENDPLEPEEDMSVGVGVTVEMVTPELEAMLVRALQRGLPHASKERLRVLIYMYDLWRLVLGEDPPADVPPLKLRLKAGAVPYKSRARRYSPEKSDFLAAFSAELVRLGWVYPNKASRWACPAVPVRKPRSDEFRQTNDYRPVNAMTDAIVGVMPNLHVVLERCRGKKYYAVFDFLKGFWQLPLHVDSQEILSYMTDRGVFTPTRVPQGCTDAALHFQATMELVLAELLYKNVLVWIDDVLVYADTVDELLTVLERLFALLDERGLKLSPKKSDLFLTEVKWCGRIINEHGIRHDPDRIQALCDIPEPTTAGELQQFICASNWMRESLVDYARVVDPLQQLLDRALSGQKKTKRTAAGIPVTMTAEESKCFAEVKELLRRAATLAHPDPAKQMCVLTDASDVGWGLIVTQVGDWKRDAPVHEQHHELLLCMGGAFRGAALNWSVIEKEAYPIAHACEHLEYLLLRPQGFHLYCDHRNIVYLFAPSKEMKKHVRGKLLRWSTKLLGYRYVIEHIDGPSNVWADLLSRWGRKGTATSAVKRLRLTTKKRSRSRKNATPEPQQPMRPRPLDDEGFVWPTLGEIGRAQSKNLVPRGASVRDDDGLVTVNGRIWIPENDDLLQRVMVIAHCGSNGHRGVHVMANHLKKVFHIESVMKKAIAFCKQCLLCLHVKGGKVIPRPWSEKFRCAERNKALHWDFIFMGESFGDLKYLLVLKDEATHFTELTACDEPRSEVAAEAMLEWHSRFGSPEVWISDRGSHFKNMVIAELNRRLKSRQDFVLAYCPWQNGTVERVNRDIVQVTKALILEYKISRKDWVYLIPVIQSSLNHSPVQSLANKAPVELLTGLECPSPLNVILAPGNREKLMSGDLEKPDIAKSLEQLRSGLQQMHKQVVDEKKKRTEQNKLANENAKPANFGVGDFVLRSRVDENRHPPKLLVTWVGPYRVVKAEEFHYILQHLITGEEQEVHPSRMKFYADKDLQVTQELTEHVAAQETRLAVRALVGHQYNDNKKAHEIKVSWKGLESIEDSWEDLASVDKDVPTMLREYVAGCGDAQLQELVQLDA